MQVYAMQAKDRVLIDQATEIRLRAERRAGVLLAEMAERGERDQGSGGDRKSQSHAATVKLSDLGINKSQSSRWQKLADKSDDDFEELIENAKQRATAAVDREPKPKPKPKPKPGPKHKKDRAEVIATCVSDVETIVRRAIKGMDADERADLWDQLRRALDVIKAKADAIDEDLSDGLDEDRWTEDTGVRQ
jgi:hypothetical protein